MLYSKNSPAIMSQLLSMVFVNCLAFQEEGMKGVKECWKIPSGASIFIVIGLWQLEGLKPLKPLEIPLKLRQKALLTTLEGLKRPLKLHLS